MLELTGELDTTTAPQLRERVAQLAAAPAPWLIVDLDRLAFLDSSGLAVLVGARRAVRGAGGDLRLVTATERWLTLCTAALHVDGSSR